MPTSSNTSNAITSPFLEAEIGKKLKQHNIKFYLVYRIGIETGMPCNRILELKVQELKGKRSLFYPPKISNTDENPSLGTTAPLSSSLIEEIDQYLYNKNDDEYAFCGEDGVSKLSVVTFQSVLKAAAKKCGAEGITSISLRKTYVYHLYLQCGDVNKIRRLLRLSTNKKVYEYLGIQGPTHDEDATPDYRRALIQGDFIKHVTEQLGEQLLYIRTAYQEPLTPDLFYSATMEFLQSVDCAITLYQKQTEPIRPKGNPDGQL